MPEERLRFLADASMMLADSSDICDTLAKLAAALVPTFADWCTISIREDDGVVRRIAGHHVDPALAPMMAAYLAGFAPSNHRNSSMIEAVHEGQSFFMPHVDPAFLEAAAQNAEHLGVLRALGCTSSIVVPLIARGNSNGALSLSMSTSARVFDEIAHQLARELGTLIGLAVDNARRFAAERAARERAERAEAETRELLAERQVLLQRAEAANRAKDEYLAILGHELRNPLAPIVTAIDMFNHRGGTPTRELVVIERQTRHMVRLLDDLLDVSRIARGRVVLERRPIECAAIVATAVEMATPLFEQHQHQVTIDVPPGLVLDGDPTRLTQVLANLLTNAASYTPAQGSIAVRAERQGDHIAIAVRDSGQGITAVMLPHVFEMFVQERQQLDRSRGGLGLGLTIVKSLIEAHGGTVSAHSDGAGRGSEFTIRLLAAAAAPAETVPVPVPLPQIDAGRRVLVVDDNNDAAELLAEAIGMAGYVVRIARDGQEALEVTRDFCPEAAVLDIGLPVMDGYELARLIRTSPGGAEIYLIALTGYSQAADRERAKEAGFDCHLVKPISLMKIRTALDTALRVSSGIPARK